MTNVELKYFNHEGQMQTEIFNTEVEADEFATNYSVEVFSIKTIEGASLDDNN